MNRNYDLKYQKTEYFADDGEYDITAMLRRMTEWFEVTNAAPVFIHITDTGEYLCGFVGHDGTVTDHYLDRKPVEKKEIFWAKEIAMNELTRSVFRRATSELNNPNANYDDDLNYCNDMIIEAARQLTGAIANEGN